MMVRIFWRNCNFGIKSREITPVDAFWVEATKNETNLCIFPFLLPSQIEKSKRLALEYKTVSVDMGNPDHAFCFLVARDLSFIEPLDPHYPIHHLWNAYSPFESMPAQNIDSLESLRMIAVPAAN